MQPDFPQRLVYDCNAMRAEKGGLDHNETSVYYDKLPPFYKLSSLQDQTLVFESRFESGNLHIVT